MQLIFLRMFFSKPPIWWQAVVLLVVKAATFCAPPASRKMRETRCVDCIADGALIFSCRRIEVRSLIAALSPAPH